jgi:adenylate cyclase
LPFVRWLRKGRAPVVLLIALAALLIGHADWFRGIMIVQRWEAQAHDARLQLRGQLPPHPDILVVGVETSSMDQTLLAPVVEQSEALRLMAENPVPPWPRKIHVHVLERLLAAGAKVVAVDFVFFASLETDGELGAVLQKYPGRVVLASTVQSRINDNGQTEVNFRRANETLRAAAGPESEGFVTFPGSTDGIFRRFDYRTSEVHEHPRLSATMDDPCDLWKFAPLAVRKFSNRELPADYGEPLNYSGGKHVYPVLPVENLFIQSIWEKDPRYQGGAVFRDKLVFYGPIAEIFHDVMNTPFGTMAGVQVHAQLAASLLRGDVLRDGSVLAEWAIAIACALAVTAVVLLVPHALWQALAVVGIAGVFWFGTQAAFAVSGILFPAVPALFATAVTGASGVVFLFFLEQWEKVQVRKVLDRSVNKRIAKVMLQNEEFDHARRGERRPVTILFSDIRSFTTWSERAEPEHLVGQLNEYFERMVDLIEREGSLGNAQKFIGDAILAAWGDTPENRFGDAEDARRAVAAALQMRPALKELNGIWASRADRTPISIGMGVNIGEVVVGEVGHPDRREYTVLGDGVNSAARLESATKQFHTDCLVGESVEVLTRKHFVFRHVDYVRVKGKTKPINIYIPVNSPKRRRCFVR